MLAVIVGVAFYLKSPQKYKSTSLLIYQRQRISPSKMLPDIKVRTQEMVSTLTQQVTSRTSLEAIIKQFDLYKKALEELPMEDVIISMRENIVVAPSSREGDIFHVEFIGSDPKKVMLVTNAIAAKFIEENLRFRSEKATETSVYVKDELQMAKVSLDKKEALMRDYKLKYYDEMPQQLQINMSRLSSLQTQLQSSQEGIRDLERTRILIQEQIASRNEVVRQAEAEARVLAEGGSGESSTSQQETLLRLKTANLSDEERKVLLALLDLNKNKDELDELLLKYTDGHPEVRKLKKSVAALEKKHAEFATAAQKAKGDGTAKRNTSMSGLEDGNLLQLEQLKIQLKGVSYNISNLKENEKKALANIEKYQKWIEAAPVREAEWSALTRDYNQLSNHYQELVSMNLNAASAETIERRQKGSQFKIVDSAHFPEKPYTPDFIKIMAIALGLGLGIGGGGALLVESIDTSFKDAKDVESFLGVPVACSILFVPTSSEKKIARVQFIAWTAAFIFFSTTIAGGIAFLVIRGSIII